MAVGQLALSSFFLVLLGTAPHLPLAAAKPKVFGLGPGRTGSDSLKRALNELGFGPAYHMDEVMLERSGISTEGHLVQWRSAALGQPVDFQALLEDWGSGVDFPLSSFPQELLAAFPDARFVLSKRPGAKWFRSINASICAADEAFARFPISLLKYLPFKPMQRQKLAGPTMDDIIKYKFAPGLADSWREICSSETTATAALEAWNARVEAMIPKEQLLVFELGKSGYNELADFLGVRPPEDLTFPRVNTTERIKTMILVAWCVSVAMVVGGSVLGLYLLMRLARLLVKCGRGHSEKKER